jgi:hypothetical protein
MKFRSCTLLVPVCAHIWLLNPAFAQEEASTQTREEWQAQVERSRQRVEQIRREGKFVDKGPSPEAVTREIDSEISRRALDDEDLRPGDLVSTNRGLLRFEGVTRDNSRIFTAVPQQP